MAIVKRLTRLLTADAHAVLDLIEDPMVLLKQSLREMDDALQVQQNHLSNSETHYEKLTALLASNENERIRLDEELDLCFQSDNLHLARGLVKKKLMLKAQRLETEHSVNSLTKTIEQLKSQIKESIELYEATNLKAEILEGQISHAQQSVKQNHVHISEEDIEIAFIKEQKARVAP